MKTSNTPVSIQPVQSSVLRTLAILFTVIGFAGFAFAGTKNWAGPSPGTTTAPQSGTWDTSSLNWSATTGAGNAAFTAGTVDGAVFGGADGTYSIQLATGLGCTNITFANSGYTISAASPVTITNSGVTAVTVASGKTATIGANITLRVTGNAAVYNNGVTAGGTLIIDNGATYTQPGAVGLSFDGVSGSTVRVLTGGTLSHTGAGSQVRIGVTANSDATVSVEGGSFIETGSPPMFNIGVGAGATGTLTISSGLVSNINSGSLDIGVGANSIGRVNLNGGVIAIRNMIKGISTATTTFNFNGGTLKAASSASAGTFMNGLDTANVRNGGAVIDNNGFDITIGQTLLHSTVGGDNATDGGLTLANAGLTTGSVSVTNANTYNGPTTIPGGNKLITTTRSIGSGSYSVANSGALEVQVAASGQSLGVSSLTLGTGGNVTNNFTLGANGSATPVILDNGALNLNGPVFVTVSANGLTAGTYPLISYSSISGSGTFTAVSLPAVAGFTASLTNDTTSKELKLVYASAPQPVKWAVGNGNWDTTSLNWNLLTGSGPVAYVEGAAATFDDTATGASPVTIALTSDHSPNTITNSSSKNFVLTGNFNLVNSALTKQGSSTLVLDNGNGNTFSALAILNGALQVGNADTGGSLGSGIISNNASLVFNRTDDTIVNNLIAGSGSVVKNGPDIVTLAATNSYVGLTAINSGQIALGTSLINSTVSNNVVNGLGFATGVTAPAIGGLAGTGDISLLNAGSSLVNLTVGSNNLNTTFSGAFTGAGNLMKAGTGNLTISGSSAFNSVQVLAPGILTIADGTSTMNNALQVVSDNATLNITGGNITVATDARIAGSNSIISVSGGVLNLPKLVLGSTATSTNAVMTVSGNAVVSQNQPGGSPATALWIGGNNGGSGALVLKDNASFINTATTANTVVIGNNGVGQGSFTIQDNATFNNATVIRLADLAGNGGFVNLNGGVMSVNGFSKGVGTIAIRANGGTLQALVPTASFFANVTNSILLLTNGLKFDNNGNDVTITNSLTGLGGLTKLGVGILTLSGTNTYTGPTIVNGGIFNIANPTAISSSVSLAITNATLVLSNIPASNTALSVSDSTIQLAVINFPTNIITGAFSTAGGANVINISTIAGSGVIPQATPLIQYTSLAPGVVDGNNNLTTLSATLPDGFTGYLTNNTVRKTIDLVLTGGNLGPLIIAQPVSTTRYKGGTAQFSITAFGATSYLWRTNGVALSDGGNISGSTSNTVALSNLTLAQSGTTFDVVAANASGSVTSSVVTLTVLDATNYVATNLLFGPVSYYRFSEPDNSQPAADLIGGRDGTYLVNVSHVAGPQPGDGYVNFEPDNAAILCAAPFVDAHVNISNSWNIATNTVTLVGWFYPIGNQNNFAGLIQNRGGGFVAGLNYSAATNLSGSHTLGYTWNNDAGTYGWDSGLVPPQNQWSMVALVVTPTNATIYVANTNGVASSVHVFAHPVQSFNGPIAIGSDLSDPGNRSFTGYIDEVSAFNHALTASNISDLLTAASGITSFPPVITTEPAPVNAFEHQVVQLTAQAAGTSPLFYQWMKGSSGVYANVSNGATGNGSTNFGVNTPSLVISNIDVADAADYILVVSNNLNQVTTSIVATVTVSPVSPPETITMSVVEASGQDWNTASAWSDGLPASTSAVQKFGSTYRILAGGGMRTPNTASDNAFPGDVLFVDGSGAFESSIVTDGALILKDQSPGALNFKKLVMDGGEILSFTDGNANSIIGGGEMNVIANAAVAGLSTTGGRSITIRSQLTGNGNIQYVGYPNTTFQPTVVTALNISNANNTYTGTWFAESGTLVGSSPGALGTNSITINTNGVLQTTYDINNPNGDLVLWGHVNLTQNDTFGRVFINGVQLTAGVYTVANLISTYPNNFTATWTGQTGADSFTTASGSITVGSGGIVQNPGTLGIANTGGALQITWTNANTLLLSATNLLGPWTTNVGATSPYTVTNDAPQKFFRLRTP